MRYSKRSQKRMIIIGLLSIVFLMCVGYAAFSTVLTINSTSEITSAWDVEITNVRGVNDSSLTYNDAYDKVEPSISNDKHSVIIQTGLVYPGDTRIYEVEVTNKGNIDAQVSTVFSNVINDSTIFSFDGVSPAGSDGEDILSPGGSYNPNLLETAEPFDLPAFTNNKRYLYLMIKFKDNVTSQPKDLNPSVTLTINAVQKTENTPTVPVGEETVLMNGVEVPVVTSGDGLYEDEYEEGRYIYRGTNDVDNYIYIKENGTDVRYRIYSVESDGSVKVVRDESIISMNFDADDASRRKSGYCSQYNFCNAWTKMDIFTNGTQTGAVSLDSSIKEYIDGTYVPTLNDYDKITTKTWNIAGTLYNRDTIANTIADESKSTWSGKVALITASEYARANSNTSACGTLANLVSNYSTCKNTNYLHSSSSWWLLSPYSSVCGHVLAATSYGRVRNDGANDSIGVRPSFYLCSGLTYSGKGTFDEPYEMSGNCRV